MSRVPITRLPVAGAIALAALLSASATAQVATPQASPPPRATLHRAAPLVLPGAVDSNSPGVWDLVAGQPTLSVVTSFGGQPRLATGPSLTQLGPAEVVASSPDHGIWMEAVVSDDQGTWYGYYHNELSALMCGRPDRFVVRIGAARSLDRGRTWEDLGIILEGSADSVACDSPNRYVLGGVGDLSVMLDPDGASRSTWVEYPVGTPLVPTTEAWHDGDDNRGVERTRYS